MRIRQTIKKAIALGTGALMLGATILGASAANLSDYPGLFLVDGKVSAKLVVGEKAATADVLGAIDIAADLQANAVSKEAVTVTGTGISVTGGKTKEIVLGDTLSSFTTLDDADISGLKDEKISWNDKDLDVEEKIYINGVEILTSADDSDFAATPYLGTPTANAIRYEYIIDDSDLNISNIATTGTNKEVLKVEILGKSLEIESASGDSVSLSVANEYYLAVGDSVEVEGKTVTLKNVGSNNNVVVDVDGEIKTVTAGTEEKVGGLKVDVDSAFYVDELDQRSATLKVGNKITDDVSDGDSMELFGEPSKKSDAEWVWEIQADVANDDYMVIGATFNKKYNTDTEPVKAMGEKYTVPNNYLNIYMDSLTAAADVDVTFSFEDGITVDKTEAGVDGDGGIGEDNKALKGIASKEVFLLTVNGQNETTDIVYFIAGNDSVVYVAYEDNDDEIRLASGASTEDFWIDYEDTDIDITYDNESQTNAAVTLTGDLSAGSDNIVLIANISNERFGTLEGDYESGADYTSTFSIDKDEDYLTDWGMIIGAPEDNLDNDEFKLTLPQEQVKVNVVAVGPAGAVEGASGSVTTDKVNPVGVDFGVLDSDAPSAGTANLIVVGGPCANTEAARLLGNPANCAEGFSQGEAKLTLFDDDGKVALLVAGYSAQDTQGAVRALLTEVLPAKSDAKVITTNYKAPSIE